MTQQTPFSPSKVSTAQYKTNLHRSSLQNPLGQTSLESNKKGYIPINSGTYLIPAGDRSDSGSAVENSDTVN